jgi:hypothetical protein
VTALAGRARRVVATRCARVARGRSAGGSCVAPGAARSRTTFETAPVAFFAVVSPWRTVAGGLRVSGSAGTRARTPGRRTSVRLGAIDSPFGAVARFATREIL